MDFIKAFIIGGLMCVAGQILIDRTNMKTGRILVFFVMIGCITTALGWYEPLVNFAGAGATVPLPGFGYSLAKGVMREVDEVGIAGIFTGGLKASAAGITAAMLFGLIAALIFNPKEKT